MSRSGDNDQDVTSHGILIELSSGQQIVQTHWDGSTFADLAQVYLREYPNELLATIEGSLPKSSNGITNWHEHKLSQSFVTLRRAFYMEDKIYGVSYEGFDIEDIYPGARITVSERILLQAFFKRIEEENAGGGQRGKYELTMSRSKLVAREEAVPVGGDLPARVNSYQAAKDWMWRTLDNPQESNLALGIAVLIMILIMFSTTTFCVETLHSIYKPTVPKLSFFFLSEAVCIAFFTMEVVLRLWSCADRRAFLGDVLNVIDIISIMPFYLELMLESQDVPGLAVFRVVRLIRVLRLFKVSKGSLMVFSVTMRESLRPLWMLVALTLMAVVLFSSLVFYIERGRYNSQLGVWERLYGYSCEYILEGEYPGFEHPPCVRAASQPANLTHLQGLFSCPYTFKKDSNCFKIYKQTPFESIPGSMPYVFETMATVGYGVMSPTTGFGKMMGAVIVLFGMLVIALPITVIGSNFSTVYRELHKEDNEDAPVNVG